MMDHLPRAVLRNPIKFELASIHNYVMRRLIRTHERAANGQISKDEAPGYAIQVKIALGLLERTAPVPKGDDGERGPVTINVAIISSEVAGHQAQANGASVRFIGGAGDGA
jgi:hypothetical protein